MRIKSLCEEQGLSINRLATISKLPQSTIDNIVNGHTKNPNIKTLHKISRGLKMTLSEFFDFPEMKNIFHQKTA